MPQAAEIVYPPAKASGGASYPWNPVSGIVFGDLDDTLGDAYITSWSEVSDGVYDIGMDATVTTRASAKDGMQANLGAVGDYDVASEWAAKTKPELWRAQTLVIVHSWPSDIAANHWLMIGHVEPANSRTLAHGAPTTEIFFRNADGTLEHGDYWVWGNNGFSPGTRNRAVADRIHITQRYEFDAAATETSDVASFSFQGDGTAGTSHAAQSTFFTGTWAGTRKWFLSFQHWSAGTNPTDSMRIEIKQRLVPLIPDMV